jgi:hypothetical protein
MGPLDNSPPTTPPSGFNNTTGGYNAPTGDYNTPPGTMPIRAEPPTRGSMESYPTTPGSSAAGTPRAAAGGTPPLGARRVSHQRHSGGQQLANKYGLDLPNIPLEGTGTYGPGAPGRW